MDIVQKMAAEQAGPCPAVCVARYHVLAGVCCAPVLGTAFGIGYFRTPSPNGKPDHTSDVTGSVGGSVPVARNESRQNLSLVAEGEPGCVQQSIQINLPAY